MGGTDGVFLGIWRERTVIHTEFCIVLEKATCVTHKLAKDDGFPWISYTWEYPSSVILICLACKVLDQNFYIGLMQRERMKRLSIHQLQWYFMTLSQ